MFHNCISLTILGASFLLAQTVQDYNSGTAPSPGLHVTRVKYLLQGDGGRVDWLPNSDLIAYDTPNQSGFTDVFVMNSNGANKHCVTCGISALTEHKGNPAWHSSGKYIMFQATDPSLPKLARSRAQYMWATAPGSGWHNNLWVVAADGSSAWQLTHVNAHQGVLHAHFDARGARVTWAQLDRQAGQEHWSIKVAPFFVRDGIPQLGEIQTYTPGNLSFYETHDFSPDGSQILFSGKPQGASPANLNWGIFTFRIDTGALATLVDPTENEWNEHSHFTPDGKHIVWMTSRGIPQPKGSQGSSLISGYRDLKTDDWIMNSDGSNKRRLTYFNDTKSPMYIPGQSIPSDLSFHSETEFVCYIGVNPGGRLPGDIAVIDFVY